MEQELFEKYLSGGCNDAEAFQVEEWLNKAGGAAVDAFFLKLWNTTALPIPEDQDVLLINKLKTLTGLSKTRPIPMWTWLRHIKYYAAVGLVLIASALVFRMNHPDHLKNLLEKKGAPEEKNLVVDHIYIYNQQGTAKMIVLEDGTAVKLFKHSGLRYRRSFEENRRAVYLTGKAVFSVAREVKRPFTVFGNDISTTALGTKFLVHADKNGSAVRVKLFSGKVVISATRKLDNWQHDVFLSPGSQLQYRSDARVVVSRFALQKEAGNSGLGDMERISKGQIRFNNALLPDVMKQLCLLYHIHIHYKASDIDRMNFTGVIDRSDSIASILEIIAKMNKLKIEPASNGFEISRPAR